MNLINPLFFLALAWLAYFIMHSVLASLWLKKLVAKKLAWVMPYYRLIFNTVAVLALIPLLAYRRVLSGEMVWTWDADWIWLAYMVSALCVIGFIHSLKFYDMQEFMGFRQIKEKSVTIEDQENLHLSPYHRYVRHPWYFFAIVLIWLQYMDSAWFVSCIMLTLYFWLGSQLEDRKLVTYYGDTYRIYKEKVSGVFPLPWRNLSRKEALDIQMKENK